MKINYFPTPDAMSEICVHITLFKDKEKVVDKLLFVAPFWESEQPIIKEVIKFLFLALQSEMVTTCEEI